MPPSTTAIAGLVTAMTGFLSSFAVVLTGLRAVGATPAQAASGLLVLLVTMGLGTVLLAQLTRMPVTLAWSTPGAALLAGAATQQWPAAVGAFVVVGALFALTAVWPLLGTLVARIPVPLAQAMLAGVLVPLCLAPVQAVTSSPALALPVVATWLVLMRLTPRWAVPGAFVVTLGLVGWLATRQGGLTLGALVPRVEWTTPQFTPSALVGLALPLYVVTMASQNVPGVAVLASFGYPVPWRVSMAVTGAGTVMGAGFGGHAINLAAISAALSAGPEAGPDPAQRHRAARTAGLAYIALALVCTALTALVSAAPSGLVAAAAGLALLPVLASSLGAALTDPEARLPAIATFLVAVSGLTLGGIGPAFWALLVGAVLWVWLRPREMAAPPRRALVIA